MAAPESVDAYLATLSPDHRAALERIRSRVRELAPAAVEAISYGIPSFKLEGKGVIWYAGWKSHCSVYPLTDAFLADHADELRTFRQGKGTLQFTVEQPLPDDLLDALIRDRLADVETGGR